MWIKNKNRNFELNDWLHIIPLLLKDLIHLGDIDGKSLVVRKCWVPKWESWLTRIQLAEPGDIGKKVVKSTRNFRWEKKKLNPPVRNVKIFYIFYSSTNKIIILPLLLQYNICKEMKCNIMTITSICRWKIVKVIL